MNKKIYGLALSSLLLFSFSSCDLVDKNSGVDSVEATPVDKKLEELSFGEGLLCGFTTFYISPEDKCTGEQLASKVKGYDGEYRLFAFDLGVVTFHNNSIISSFNRYCSSYVEEVSKYGTTYDFQNSTSFKEYNIYMGGLNCHRLMFYPLYHDFVNDVYYSEICGSDVDSVIGTSGFIYTQELSKKRKNDNKLETIYTNSVIKINIKRVFDFMKSYDIVEFDKDMNVIKETSFDNSIPVDSITNYQTSENCQYVSVKERFDTYKYDSANNEIIMKNEDQYNETFYSKNDSSHKIHKMFITSSDKQNMKEYEIIFKF